MSDSDIVIIGAGLAAAKAATALREGGYAGAVTIVGEEPHPPYERPPLSKDILLGKGSRDDALVHPREWYAEHDVSLLTGRRAERLDPAAHQVHLDDGTVLEVWSTAPVSARTAESLRAAGLEVVATRSAAERTTALQDSGAARVLLLLPALGVAAVVGAGDVPDPEGGAADQERRDEHRADDDPDGPGGTAHPSRPAAAQRSGGLPRTPGPVLAVVGGAHPLIRPWPAATPATGMITSDGMGGKMVSMNIRKATPR